AASRLEMTVRKGADPDIGPGGRDRDPPDPRDRVRIADRASLDVAVAEAPAGATAGEAGLIGGGVAEAGGSAPLVVPAKGCRIHRSAAWPIARLADAERRVPSGRRGIAATRRARPTNQS